jgi:hypothetical protein
MLSKDFREFIKSLNEHDVRYLLVGGYAVAFHGHPRYTKDMDIWVDHAPDNAVRMVKALEAFGFGSLGLKQQDFTEEDQIIELGYPPTRIDIWTTLPGVKFDDCYSLRVGIAIEGVPVQFIDKENLKKNKRAAGRMQDLADVESLEE